MLLYASLFEALGQVENKTFEIGGVGDLGCGKMDKELYHQYKMLNQI
jgi:hypothetical protein